MFLNILQEVSIHLKYAYESLLEESGHSNSRSRSKMKKHTSEMGASDSLYSKSEAKTIAELSAKIIKSAIDAGDVDGEVILFIVIESPEIIVRFSPPVYFYAFSDHFFTWTHPVSKYYLKYLVKIHRMSFRNLCPSVQL